MDLPPPVNHVFVDFENVHEIDLAVIGSKAVEFVLLIGARQTKLDVSLVETLLAHATSVELVRLTSSGRNALDFALAYYVGRAVAADPSGYFHIVAKDTGYDPLIEHLRSRHIHVRRHDDFSTLSFSATRKSAPSSAPVELPKPTTRAQSSPRSSDEQRIRVLEHLRKASKNRPKSLKKLISHLVAHLGHKITEGEVRALVEGLRQAGDLSIDAKGAVIYLLEQR